MDKTTSATPPLRPKGREAGCFPKSRRILLRREFLAIQEHGKKIYSRALLIFFRLSERPSTRFGVTISKRVDKRAVVRNRFRRRAREVLRRLMDETREPLDIVVIARQGAPELAFEELSRTIREALHSRHLLKEPQQPPS